MERPSHPNFAGDVIAMVLVVGSMFIMLCALYEAYRWLSSL